ncbi:anti-sigma-B factor antagonist [bacterium BMS3Abin04]|nr:anti-sigma-B factor antagonist [bacterium BMS3Abin04]
MGKLDNYFEHLNNHISGGRFSTRSYEANRAGSRQKSADEFCRIKNFIAQFIVIEVNLERATLKDALTFKDFITNLVSDENKNIIIDLHKVNFMDSTFLGVLVSILKSLHNIDGQLKLILDFNNVALFKTISRIKNMFNIYPDIQSVNESLKQ